MEVYMIVNLQGYTDKSPAGTIKGTLYPTFSSLYKIKLVTNTIWSRQQGLIIIIIIIITLFI